MAGRARKPESDDTDLVGCGEGSALDRPDSSAPLHGPAVPFRSRTVPLQSEPTINGAQTMTEQNALVWEGGTLVAIRPVPIPESRPGWIAVDVAYAGICGSDLHIAAGEHGRAQPGIVLGHEFVGHLAEPYEDLPAGHPVFVSPVVHCGVCEACLAGRTNVCRTLTLVGIDYPGAIAPRVVVPGYGIYPLPTDVDLVGAALIEPLAVAVRAVRRSGLALGDRTHVVGAGPIGCLVSITAAAAGGIVTVSELSESRRKYATDLGLTIVEDPQDLGDGADVVFDASGHTSVAGELLRWLRAAGTAVIVGAYKPGLHGVDLLSVMFDEITIIGTRIYQRSDIEAAIHLVTTGRVDAHSLISKIFPMNEAVAAVETLRRGEGLKVLIEPGQPRTA
jgi:(R,R)-butanediol dehydrogenase / meso-butanediol dehydrogenase / diacetyl reductase